MSKLPKRTRTKKRIRWQLPEYVSFGDWLENSEGRVYIVAQISVEQAKLISLSNGNRWSDWDVYKGPALNVAVKDLLPDLNSGKIKWRLLKTLSRRK